MYEQEYLENIEWYIQSKPTIKSVEFKDSKKNVDMNDLNKIVLDYPSDIKLNLPLNDNYEAFKILTISGKQTLKSLLEIIYNFYQSKIDENLIDEIFVNMREFYEELKDELENEELKYIDTFSGRVCPPNFVGLVQEKPKKNLIFSAIRSNIKMKLIYIYKINNK